MKIRKAVLEDASVIAKLNERFFHEEGRDWVELISSSDSEMYVVEENEQIIGFTGLQFIDWNETLNVINIFIRPGYRRQGIGERLAKHLIEVANKTPYRCLITEAPSLNPVLQLYLKNGFRICGYNDRYYTNGGAEAAIFVSFDLKTKGEQGLS